MDTQKDTTKTLSKKKNTEITLANYHKISNIDDYVSVAQRSQKIVTAMYMLTDFLDSDDAMRKLLRDSVTETMGKLFALTQAGTQERSEILSFAVNKVFSTNAYLDVVYTNGFVSEMNFRVISGELVKLSHDLQELLGSMNVQKKIQPAKKMASEFRLPDSFFTQDFSATEQVAESVNQKDIASTPQKTIDTEKDIAADSMPIAMPVIAELPKEEDDDMPVFVHKKDSRKSQLDKMTASFARVKDTSKKPKTNNLKEQRKEKIITILKEKPEASINDICENISDCSSKTIQRDLIDMINSGLVKKEGTRRWSTYSLA